MIPRLTIVVTTVDQIEEKMAYISKRSWKMVWSTIQIPTILQQSQKSQSKTFASRLDALIWAERIENGDDTKQI